MRERNYYKNEFRVSVILLLSLLFLPNLSGFAAAIVDPSAKDYKGRKGTTIYVSKTGNNSDGSSWKKAYNTIQTALSAIPDDKGGHMIIVRPDTYIENNLFTAYKGAKGAYNLIVGDSDGRLGSGATGRIVIDSGDPQKGFKSYDWWGSIRATSKGWRPEFTEQTFSSICWDRWILRSLYTSGSDAGFFWDLTDKSGEGFTVIVENCVSIGRAFGGGICYPVVRPDEPSIFRGCYFLALDWVGDTGAVLIGGWEDTMPAYPHLIMEDCTLVHPDNALAMSYASNCSRVKAVNCRFIVLNFTQPEMGGKSTGIICTQGHVKKGKLHVDLEDCILAGYSLFTNGEDGKAVSYTTKGKVQAYVQFTQQVPEGFERINLWPAQLFDEMAIPKANDFKKFQAVVDMAYNTGERSQYTDVSGNNGTLTLTECKDGDDNNYPVVTINNQIWMAENLKTTKYNDGTAIPSVTDITAWSALHSPGYCWYNNDSVTYKATYGALYNWFTVDASSNGDKNICPKGWHVATDAEWTTLITYLGGETVAGVKLKEIGTTHWTIPNTAATNETGFMALPGGYRYGNGSFVELGFSGYWWSSTEYADYAWERYMSSSYSGVYRGYYLKQHGFSVRCLQDY
jgi:uncharacterized protein (TIGR02145 family)